MADSVGPSHLSRCAGAQTPRPVSARARLRGRLMDAGATKPTQTFRIETANRGSRLAASVLFVILLALVLLPAFAGRNLIQDLIFLFYMLALAQCWNLLAGYAGLISVGQQAFVGLGGYLLFALTLTGSINPLLA